ncbi:hypothetical protein ElyMa_002140000 [Elysia marginata]|uniref:Transmembrane protein n=1 Tax=Elysia marginata TaxID=1093978 RepID=A0AAV4FMG8_9GAST|nr:hypothetical protein ElyMa_002140000 [Elysia marginata]
MCKFKSKHTFRRYSSVSCRYGNSSGDSFSSKQSVRFSLCVDDPVRMCTEAKASFYAYKSLVVLVVVVVVVVVKVVVVLVVAAALVVVTIGVGQVKLLKLKLDYFQFSPINC